MFKLICILVIALAGSFIGCSSTAKTVLNTDSSAKVLENFALSSDELGSIITIRAKQVIKYKNLKLRLISVEDSRCAIGTSCIWAGQLIVTLEISNELGERSEVKLLRKREPKIANAFGYKLLLLGVEPYPKKGKTVELSDQVIKLEIAEIDAK
jgi:hypothetical protein